MEADYLSHFIMDTMEDLVYVSDIQTYELYYLNGMAKRTLGCIENSQWYRKKCYQVLQGLDAPCSFCTNGCISHEQFYNWEYYNPVIKAHFYIQDKLIDFNGGEARLEIAKNITEVKTLEQEVAQKYEEQRVLNACVGTMHSNATPDESINELLRIISDYFQAERGYIFALSADRKVIDNTYEWCKEGVVPQIENLQNIDASVVARWFEKYEAVGEFYIDSLTEEVALDSEEYEILASQDIQSLVSAPLRDKNGAIEGFIGVDNPQKNIKQTAVIKAVTTFIADFFDKNELIEKLNKLSYYDSLTGLKNRHSYSLALKRLQEGEKSTLGVVYVDMNGLKFINDKLGHPVGDRCIITVAHTLRAMFTGFSYRIGGDEFVALCVGLSEEAFMAKVHDLKAQFQVGLESKASIGCVWQEDSRDVIRQVEQADTSMYLAKQHYYSAKVDQETKGFSKEHMERIRQKALEVAPIEVLQACLPQEQA